MDEQDDMEQQIIGLISAALLPASAGGVILREKNGIQEVVVCTRSRGKVIELPKGGIEAGETVKEAAIRESQEETGLKVRVIEEIGAIPGEDIHWFRMKMTGGKFRDHDKEFASVKWMPVYQALNKLTDETHKRILRTVGLSR